MHGIFGSNGRSVLPNKKFAQALARKNMIRIEQTPTDRQVVIEYLPNTPYHFLFGACTSLLLAAAVARSGRGRRGRELHG
jgi:hypothetical protein